MEPYDFLVLLWDYQQKSRSRIIQDDVYSTLSDKPMRYYAL